MEYNRTIKIVYTRYIQWYQKSLLSYLFFFFFKLKKFFFFKFMFLEMGGLIMSARSVSNSWPQVSLPFWSPQLLGLQV